MSSALASPKLNLRGLLHDTWNNALVFGRSTADTAEGGRSRSPLSAANPIVTVSPRAIGIPKIGRTFQGITPNFLTPPPALGPLCPIQRSEKRSDARGARGRENGRDEAGRSNFRKGVRSRPGISPYRHRRQLAVVLAEASHQTIGLRLLRDQDPRRAARFPRWRWQPTPPYLPVAIPAAIGSVGWKPVLRRHASGRPGCADSNPFGDKREICGVQSAELFIRAR